MMSYEIRVKSHLSPLYSVWFPEFVIRHLSNGDTLLAGPIVDQAALYGLILVCRDLGLTLISVQVTTNETNAKRT